MTADPRVLPMFGRDASMSKNRGATVSVVLRPPTFLENNGQKVRKIKQF
jgi:hypothetical protein